MHSQPALLKQFGVVVFVGACLWFIFFRLHEGYSAKQQELAKGLSGQHSALHEIPQEAMASGLNMLNDMMASLHDDPNNPKALNRAADLSFDRGVFSRAADFYRRYLALQPEDTQARIRFAAALSSMGNREEAAEQYRSVLTVDPLNYEALSSLALLHAQSGRGGEARLAAAAAAKVAPSAGQKQRMEQLEARLRQGVDPLTAAADFFGGTAAPSIYVYDKIVNLVWNNATLGPGLSKSVFSTPSGTLVLSLNDRDWQRMDPGAKADLFSDIRAAVGPDAGAALKAVAFVDGATNKQLERLALDE